MEKANSRYCLVLTLLLISGVMTTVLRYVRVDPEKPSNPSLIPMQLDGWTGEEYLLSDFTLDVLKATSTATRLYTDPERREVSLFVGYFEDQRYGSQIHSPRHCLPGGGWGILSLKPTELQVEGRRFFVNRVVIGNRKNRQVVYYWFRTRSGELTSEYGLKLDLIYNALRLRPTDAAIIRLTAEASGEGEVSADDALQDFLVTFYSHIENSLPFETS